MSAHRSRPRRILAIATGAVVVWSLALVVAGFAAEGCQRRKIAQRIATAFEATASFTDADLSLLRGRFVGEGLTISKDVAAGSLRVSVKELAAELRPFGLALVDSSIDTLHLSGIELEASSLELLRTAKRHGKPFAVNALVLDDVHVAAMPTMLLPSFGRLEIVVEHARAGPTVLRTPLSWVFSLQELTARVALPGGVTVRLAYANGRMRAQGGVFGSTPVEIPFAIPVVDPLHELDQLKTLGLDLAKRMTITQAETWLRHGWDRVRSVVPGL